MHILDEEGITINDANNIDCNSNLRNPHYYSRLRSTQKVSVRRDIPLSSEKIPSQCMCSEDLLTLQSWPRPMRQIAARL